MQLEFKTKNKKQLEASKAWIDDVTEEILYGGAKGGGKMVGDESTVLTPFGYKKGADLQVGDLITNPDGSVQKIIQIKARETLPRTRVYFNDGTYTDVAPAHLWTAWKSTKTRKINNKVVSGHTSGEVVETQEVARWLERGYKPQIPVTQPVPFNFVSREKNKLDPYLLGLLLGDGTITNEKVLQISAHSNDISHYIGKISGEYTTHRKHIKLIGDFRLHVAKKLSYYGLLGTYSQTKFIPKQYMYGSVEDRYSLVNGLMDTDGYMPKGKHSAYYYSTSKQLAEDMAFVLRSLGAVVTITTKQGKYKKDGVEHVCSVCYCLHIKHRQPSLLFSLPRKKFDNTIKDISKGIVKIETVGEITGRCITVSNTNGLYITNDFIVTHNSFLGCSLIFGDALIYPETHYFIAREELTDLRKFTIPSIHEVFKNWGLKIEDYATFNGQDNVFTLYNGSKVFLLACKPLPSDPMFERFGSMQMTRGWMEEAGEIAEQAKANLWLSIGRWKNKEYNLKKKLLMTANPKKGWLKRDFVDLWKQGLLPHNRQFIPALATDNTYLDQDYIQTLANEKDLVRRQRLFEGNWDYEEDKDSLTSTDALSDCFSNTIVKDGQKYLIVDVARLGKDTTVFSYWDGLELYKIEQFSQQDTNTTAQKIKSVAAAEQIPFSNILIDADGIGGGVIDQLFGVKSFHANSTPIPSAHEIREKTSKINNSLITKQPYANLKAQCGWKLAELINEHKIAFKTIEYRDKIIEELTSLLRDRAVDSENKKALKPKDEVKVILGRSPDIGDTLIYRAWFELVKNSQTSNVNTVSIEQVKQMWKNRNSFESTSTR